MTAPAHPHSASLATLSLGALGVVFGDIGTSPLYTLRECTNAAGATGKPEVFGILSLIFWSLMLVVTVKYLLFMMRADNKGEGGIFALLALLPEKIRGKGVISGVALLVVIGAALLYGDGAITPAISVLSAMEGLEIASPALEPAVIPLTCVILFLLFFVQKNGTGTIGKVFGPIMVVWFVTLGALGANQVIQHPQILGALSPIWAVDYLGSHGWKGPLILGSVVLAVTGGEALYADMGHFGRRPIRVVWLVVVLPALMLNYLGQGALVMSDATALDNPFFKLVPDGAATYALVILSSAATVIASQALISGAFSLTRQAMLLGYFPRVTIRHTAEHTEGQIYIPEINWLLAATCIVLVLAFRSSDRLAAAYGIAVTGTMGITSIVYYLVTRHTWHWPAWKSVPLLVLFLSFDLPFFGTNLFKFFDGGYVPILIGVAFIAAMLIWSRGRNLIVENHTKKFPRFEDALPLLQKTLVARVPGTAVFFASSVNHLPACLMQLTERGHSLQEHVILATLVHSDSDPRIPESERAEISKLDAGFWRIVIRAGFMEQPQIHDIIKKLAEDNGVPYGDDVTYYIGRESVLAGPEGGMGHAAETVYGYLQRNAATADRSFGLPPKQVIEIGTQIDL